MDNDYLITSGDFIASSNIEHPIQFSILHYQNLWGDACLIRVKSWSKTNKTSIDCSDQWTKFLSWEIKKDPLFLALCFSGNQSSRYRITMMIKKRIYNRSIHLVISKDCLWCCITQKPGDGKNFFIAQSYTYVNASISFQNNLFDLIFISLF